MDTLRTGVFVLFVLLVPVSCEEVYFTELCICYSLDWVLIIYCIIATVFYFRGKFSSAPSVAIGVPEDNEGVYQILERPKDADPYQVLEPSKRKDLGGSEVPRLIIGNENRQAPPDVPRQRAVPPTPPSIVDQS